MDLKPEKGTQLLLNAGGVDAFLFGGRHEDPRVVGFCLTPYLRGGLSLPVHCNTEMRTFQELLPVLNDSNRLWPIEAGSQSECRIEFG